MRFLYILFLFFSVNFFNAQMPKWIPANNNGKLERCWVRVRIIFDLRSEN